MESKIPFKKERSHDNRLRLSLKILSKHPNRIPIIVNSVDFYLEKTRYIVPNDITVGQFIIEARKYIKGIDKQSSYKDVIGPEQSIFIVIESNNLLPPSSTLMGDVYKKYKDSDGFLYLRICQESTFGENI